jgi:hypothetical protein
MTKAFKKQPKDWLRYQQANDFITALSVRLNSLSADLLIVAIRIICLFDDLPILNQSEECRSDWSIESYLNVRNIAFKTKVTNVTLIDLLIVINILYCIFADFVIVEQSVKISLCSRYKCLLNDIVEVASKKLSLTSDIYSFNQDQYVLLVIYW